MHIDASGSTRMINSSLSFTEHSLFLFLLLLFFKYNCPQIVQFFFIILIIYVLSFDWYKPRKFQTDVQTLDQLWFNPKISRLLGM